MPSFFNSFALPALALAGGALANPLKRGDDACLAAVTGKAALGDENLRSFHCSSFIKTIVTPAAITVTTTVTDAPSPFDGKPKKFKRDVTVCPNDVPNYASACDLAGYKSACKVFGISSETTYTIPATTVTKTVYAGRGACTSGTATTTVTSTITIATGYGTGYSTVTRTGEGFTTTVTGNNGVATTLTGANGIFTYTDRQGFSTTLTNDKSFTFTGTGPVSTVTETVTVGDGKGNSTVTETVTVGDGKGNTTVTATVTAGECQATTVVKDAVTVTASGSSPAAPSGVGKCVTKERADALVAGFINLLEYTSYAGSNLTTPPTPAGRGYNYNVSADIFDSGFFDVSDSINWMAGFPLGSTTFGSKAAFDYGQGVLQAEVQVQAIKVWYGCNTVTWTWLLTPLTQASVRGINHFVLNADATKIAENYAEFDNAAWLSSYGLQCKLPSN